MADYFDISFIGAGNVAHHLAPHFENAGHTIHEVFSRKDSHAEALVDKLYSAEAVTTLDFSDSRSTLFIIAVPDEHIASVCSAIVLPSNSMLLHTAGAVDLNVLEGTSEHAGVFYPLQTFSIGRKVSFKEIPICLEASDKRTKKALRALAKSLTKRVYEVSSDDRRVLHLAAVFACNFSNHMHAIAEDILQSQNLPADMLMPLIIETVEKSVELGANGSQTGPAKRGDLDTIKSHIELLSEKKKLRKLYKAISDHIQNKYS